MPYWFHLHRGSGSGRRGAAFRACLAGIPLLLLSLSFAASIFLPPACAPGAALAALARPGTPVDGLTSAHTRKLLLGEQQFWNPNLRVTLLLRAPAARERDVVLKVIYGMNEAEFRQYWISKMFRAESMNGPKVVYSNEMA